MIGADEKEDSSSLTAQTAQGIILDDHVMRVTDDAISGRCARLFWARKSRQRLKALAELQKHILLF